MGVIPNGMRWWQVPSFCPSSAMAAAGRRLRVTAGDFKALYGQGGPAARKFDCVVMKLLQSQLFLASTLC